jgi:hypothetical protein
MTTRTVINSYLMDNHTGEIAPHDLNNLISELVVYDTVTDVQAATIDAGISSISTLGNLVRGDGGNALYVLSSLQQAGANKIQSADGQYWESVTPAAPDTSEIVADRIAAGSNAALDTITWAVGDPASAYTYPYSKFSLKLNDYLSGDLSTEPTVSGLALYNGYKHTGTVRAFNYGIDLEQTINSDSTGPFTGVYSAYFSTLNYGSGPINDLEGVYTGFGHAGTGLVTSAYGIQISNYAGGPITTAYGVYIYKITGAGAISTAIGLFVDDYSGRGSANSFNIWSKGVNSTNKFEGQVDVNGNASIENTGGLFLSPGDPVNQFDYSPYGSYDVSINKYHTGDLSVKATTSLINYSGYKHTGTAKATFLGTDIEPFVNSDSTGPIGGVYGVYSSPTNYSAATIDRFISLYAGVTQRNLSSTITDAECVSASGNIKGNVTTYYNVRSALKVVGGTVATSYGVSIDTPTLQGTGAIINNYGLVVNDQSAIGTTDHVNIWSKGAGSINKIEGILRLGVATNASPQDGDLWFDGTNFKARVGGVTKTLTLS